MSLCCCFLIIPVPFPREHLRPFLDPSEPSADLMGGLAPPFGIDAERIKVLLKAFDPVFLPYSGVSLTPEHLPPKHHPPGKALLHHAFQYTPEYPSAPSISHPNITLL